MAGMRFTGHVKNCAEAVITPVEDCECGCSGAFHGGPHTWRARALAVTGRDLKTRRAYAGRQVNPARTKARNAAEKERSVKGTDFLVTLAIEAVVLLDEPDEAKRVEEGVTLIVGPLVDEIANASLTNDDSAQLKTLVSELHLLCTLCVLILEAKKSLGTFVDDTVDELVDRIVDAVMDAVEAALLPDALVTVLKAALRRAGMAIVEWAFEPVNEKALQVLGILFCPNTEHHPEVVEMCIVPLEGEFLSSVVIAWAKAHYPFEKSILAGRNKSIRV